MFKITRQKEAGKLQWSQNPSQMNGDNMDNVRRVASRIIRNKNEGGGHIWKTKLITLKQTEQNIKNLYRGINEFEKGYQPRTHLLKDENSDLLADSQYFE
jgi:hypothetical protein